MRAERDDDIAGPLERRSFPWIHLLIAAGIVLVVAYFWFVEESPPSSAELASPTVALPQPIPPQAVIPITPDIPRTVPVPRVPAQAAPGGDEEAQAPQEPAAPSEAPSEDEADQLLLDQVAQLGFGNKLRELQPVSHPLFTSAALLDGMSRGKLLRKLLPVSKLEQPFVTEGEGDTVYMGTSGYRRYDDLVASAVQVDPDAVVQAFHALRPLFEWAFEGLGLDRDDFDNAVIRTLDLVLATPELERQLALQRKPVMFLYAEPELEALAPLQKQLLRMGPDNIRQLKTQAQAIRSGLLGG